MLELITHFYGQYSFSLLPKLSSNDRPIKCPVLPENCHPKLPTPHEPRLGDERWCKRAEIFDPNWPEPKHVSSIGPDQGFNLSIEHGPKNS